MPPTDPSPAPSAPDDTQSAPPHASVLPREVRAFLALRPGQTFVDATLGAGGHSLLLLPDLAPGGRLIGLDVDPAAQQIARTRLEPEAKRLGVELLLVPRNFAELPAVLDEVGGGAPHGILADLGVSSMQFDTPERGFSFQHDAPLDMRMDPALPHTGADLLAELDEAEIADLLYLHGGERGSRRIARAIVYDREAGRPVKTTGQLEALVRRALRVRGHQRIHPATRTFQALRIAVNREMDVLARFLEAAPERLAPGGTLAVISFHSGEDRLAKQRFKALHKTGRFRMVEKSVVRPGDDEARANPRSRSAKLRGLRRASDA